MIKHKKLHNSKSLHKTLHKSLHKTLHKTKTSYKSLQKAIPIEFTLTEKQVEFILLYSTIINHFLFLINNGIPKRIIKQTMINLLKDLRNHNEFISNKITDKRLDMIYNQMYKHILLLKNKIEHDEKHMKTQKMQMKMHLHNQKQKNTQKKTQKNTHTQKHKAQSAGFYFKSLEEKGDQPITGADLTKLLDESQQFFYNAQYTEEGKFLQDTNALLSMLRGDVSQFKGLLQYRIFPQYYQITPPFIKWDGIKKAIQEQKYEDLPDYLLAYQSYLRSRDEYLVEKGLKSPNILGQGRYTGFFDKLAHSLDTNITKFQAYRRMAKFQAFPVNLPT